MELERAFFLDDADKALVAKRRGEHSRLGFAVQLTTARFLGTFLPDPLDVPAEVVAYLAQQLAIADPSCVKRYTERRTTRFEHAEEIKAAYGLREFAAVDKDLAEWVDARVREEANQRLWDTLSGLLTPPQRRLLDGLLDVPVGARVSDLERWRKGPTK